MLMEAKPKRVRSSRNRAEPNQLMKNEPSRNESFCEISRAGTIHLLKSWTETSQPMKNQTKQSYLMKTGPKRLESEVANLWIDLSWNEPLTIFKIFHTLLQILLFLHHNAKKTIQVRAGLQLHKNYPTRLDQIWLTLK